MTVFDQAAFYAAHTKLIENAKALTDGDIEQLGIVSPKLADQARAKRQNLVPAETADERKMLDRPATFRDLMQGFEDVIFPLLALGRYKREQLEARVVALEAKPHVKFCGVYESGRSYTPGDACTHGGGLWICKAATTGQPNQDYAGWQLAVKSRSIP